MNFYLLISAPIIIIFINFILNKYSLLQSLTGDRHQLFTENKDVIRLVALLDETKAQLAQAKEAEALARTDKTIAIGQVLSIQAELDLALADIAILSASNQELRSQFSEVAVS